MNFRRYLIENWQDYRASWRGTTGKFNADHFDKSIEALRDEKGKPVAFRNQLTPKKPMTHWAGDIIPKQEGVIHRGMSHDEYRNMMKHGKIQSRGTGNIGKQQEGLTYFATDPATAGSYAHSFAMRKHKPTPNKPAYVVSIKKPDASRIVHVEGTGDHEIGVKGHISTDDIVSVHRGNVVSHNEHGSTVHWEKIK